MWCFGLCVYVCFVFWIFEIGKSVVAFRYAKEVCDAVVAKCLTGRPKTVEKSQAVFMLWVELEAVDVFLVHFLLTRKIVIATPHYFSEKNKNFKKRQTQIEEN